MKQVMIRIDFSADNRQFLWQLL